MKSAKKKSGAALAVTAAALFSVASVTLTANAHDETTGRCVGGNSCKGQSACHTATSSCAGTNSCKGKGWVNATKEECEANGGVLES